MSAQHPYHQLEIPPGGPFELKPSPGKAWGGFATRHIKKGSVILREKALFTIAKPNRHDITDDDVIQATKVVPQDKISQFLLLKNNVVETLADLTHAFVSNHFSLVLSGDLSPHHSVPTAQGLFVLLSRFNHSCIPNASMPMSKGDSISCIATKDIRPGEEITFAYMGMFECMPNHARHKLLYFVCKCKACLPGTAFHQASELRRQLLRGLNYPTLGLDMGQENPKPPSQIIADPKLREDAKGLCNPPSSRCFFDIFTVFFA